MVPRLWFRRLQWGLLILGILSLGLWSRARIVAHTFQSSESARLDAAQAQAASNPSPAGVGSHAAPHAATPRARPERSAVLGRLEIPRLRIAAIVAEGVDMGTLGRAVGHIPTTAQPGSTGNCALAGHRDTFLRGLGAVRVDDVVHIVTPERTYSYRVEWTEVVDPIRIDVLDPTPGSVLTLITCYPFTYVGHAPKRFIVRARQLETVAGVAVGRRAD